jgi:hypothetical protein
VAAGAVEVAVGGAQSVATTSALETNAACHPK